MTETQRQKAYIRGIQPPDEPMCGNCAYYHAHYSRISSERYMEVFCGHCAAGYTKHREPWNTCKRFEKQSS